MLQLHGPWLTTDGETAVHFLVTLQYTIKVTRFNQMDNTGLSSAELWVWCTQFGSPYPAGANSEDVMYFTTNGLDTINNPVVCITAIPNAAALLTPVRHQTHILIF